jgi:hypothetical protein
VETTIRGDRVGAKMKRFKDLEQDEAGPFVSAEVKDG